MKWIQKMVIVSVVMLLGACGTTEQSGEQAESSQETGENKQEKTAETAADIEENTESKTAAGETGAQENQEETVSESPSSKEKVRLLEQNLTYQKNGQPVEKTAFLKTSENQSYSLYVFENYELIEEEPGKDLIQSKENENAFMRIEAVPADMDADAAEQTLKTTAEAIGSEVQQHKDFSKEGLLKDAVWYKVSTEEDAVNLILVKGEKLFKLSIYTPKSEENIEPFLAMAQTIEFN